MINYLSNRRRKKIAVFENYLIVSLFIISSTTSTSNLGQSLFFIAGSFTYTLFILFKRNYIINKKILNIVGLIIFFYLIYLIKFSSYNPKFSFRISLFIIYSFVIIRILKYDFFNILINIIYVLAIISIPLYVLQLLYFEKVYEIVESIQNHIPFLEREVIQSANILIWSIQKNRSDFRNCGFMWEPGAFAAMLLLPIMFELARNKFKITRKVIIMVVALLTTLSTMGYIALFIITLWINFNIKIKYVFLLIPILLITVPYALQLSFMQEKIIEEYIGLESRIDKTISSNYEYASFGRVGSLIMDLNDWKKNPIIGIGGQYEEISYFGNKGERWINRTNGFSNYILTFGIIGIIILFYALNNSFKQIVRYFNVKGKLFFIAIIIVLSFSNSLLITPLFFVFQTLYLSIPKFVKELA